MQYIQYEKPDKQHFFNAKSFFQFWMKPVVLKQQLHHLLFPINRNYDRKSQIRNKIRVRSMFQQKLDNE